MSLKVIRPAPEFLLVRADPVVLTTPGGIFKVQDRKARPTRGVVLDIGYKAKEETLLSVGSRILWTAEAITITVEENEQEGNLLIMHFENVRAVIE